jgi:transposase
MRQPTLVRSLTPTERQVLEAGLRSAEAFTVRRCQILLKSAEGCTPKQIERQLNWSDQCVREAVHAFHAEGLTCLRAKSKRPHTAQKLLDEKDLEQLKDLLHRSPRAFGLPTSRWTLEGLAQVCAVQGLTKTVVSDETIRDAMKRLGVSWQRAKRWLESPDPAYARKKGPESG